MEIASLGQLRNHMRCKCCNVLLTIKQARAKDEKGEYRDECDDCIAEQQFDWLVGHNFMDISDEAEDYVDQEQA